MRIGRIGTIGVLVVMALATTGAKQGAEKRASPAAGGPQEAEVTGVLVEPQTRQPVVVLQGKRDKRPLVMSIGHFEAERIAIGLQGVTPPRPLTHDLILTLLGDLRASLLRVVITDLRDNVYYALIHLESQGTQFTIDSRPSDAIALAVRARVPILIEDRVFDKAERAMPKPGAPTPHF
jgi:bifunctional DNase/RNase